MRSFALKHKALFTAVCILLIALIGFGALEAIQAVNDSPKNELKRLFDYNLPKEARVIHHSTENGEINDAFLMHVIYRLEVELPPDKYPELEAAIDRFFSESGVQPIEEENELIRKYPNGIPEFFSYNGEAAKDMEVVRHFDMPVCEAHSELAKHTFFRNVAIAKDAAGYYHLFVYTFI